MHMYMTVSISWWLKYHPASVCCLTTPRSQHWPPPMSLWQEKDQWENYCHRWLASRADWGDAVVLRVRNLIEKYVPRTLEHIGTNLVHLTPVPDICMVATLCTLLQATLLDAETKDSKSDKVCAFPVHSTGLRVGILFVCDNKFVEPVLMKSDNLRRA